MIDKELFKEKYNTQYKQLREESYLEEVSDEDREIYTEAEILTGKTSKGLLNKFHQIGYNKGKKYNTMRSRAMSSFKKFIDNKIADEEIEEIWENLFKRSKKGDSQFIKLFMDRVLGKEEERIKLDMEDITFSIDNNSFLKNIKKEKEKEDE